MFGFPMGATLLYGSVKNAKKFVFVGNNLHVLVAIFEVTIAILKIFPKFCANLRHIDLHRDNATLLIFVTACSAAYLGN